MAGRVSLMPFKLAKWAIFFLPRTENRRRACSVKLVIKSKVLFVFQLYPFAATIGNY